jgi:hypothetical protein
VSVVSEILLVGVCALISIGSIVPLVLVWRDDHTWLDRPSR